MKAPKTVFVCTECGAQTPKWLGKCPDCGAAMSVRKSKRGKVYYSCVGYPDCKFMSWDIPTGDRCPECNEPLIKTGRGTVKCSGKDCKYRVNSEEKKKLPKQLMPEASKLMATVARSLANAAE